MTLVALDSQSTREAAQLLRWISEESVKHAQVRCFCEQEFAKLCDCLHTTFFLWKLIYNNAWGSEQADRVDVPAHYRGLGSLTFEGPFWPKVFYGSMKAVICRKG